jgi:hypothetical protein
MRKPNLTSQQRRDIAQALLLMVVLGDVELTIIVSSLMSKNTQIVDQKFLRMLA